MGVLYLKMLHYIANVDKKINRLYCMETEENHVTPKTF